MFFFSTRIFKRIKFVSPIIVRKFTEKNKNHKKMVYYKKGKGQEHNF